MIHTKTGGVRGQTHFVELASLPRTATALRIAAAVACPLGRKTSRYYKSRNRGVLIFLLMAASVRGGGIWRWSQRF